MELTPAQLERYARHTILPQVGVEGQKLLLSARVLLIGAGGLGSPAALYLAAAGVGTLGIVDHDRVDVSNLQRQVLHSTDMVGEPKLESARRRIAALNPDVRVETHEVRLSSANALDILRDYDVVIDGTDNFPTRYLSNDACVMLGKPNIYGSVYQFEGQASVFWAGRGPCYRCVFPEPPPAGAVPSCAEGGVLGILPGVIGMIQATETVKLILGLGESLAGRLLLYDAARMEFRTIRLRRNPECPVCGDSPTIRELIDYEQFCGVATDPAPKEAEITPGELAARLGRGEDLPLLDVRNPHEYSAGHLPGAVLIPLGELPGRLGEIENWRGREFAVYCQMGVRSARAVGILRDASFSGALNVTGGYARWLREANG
jgi:sulfur-carrier protein adenylyltransferase/sulfurtransferase